MERIKFFCAGTTQAAALAAKQLQSSGIAFAREPGPDVTDLLLDVPSFDANGNLRDGEDPQAILSRLSPLVRIWGGKLNALSDCIRFDLLEDPMYLKENAAITADCALKVAAPLLSTTWKSARVVIIGWGRIGKELSRTLKVLGSDVTVCARKSSDRALLRTMGYRAAAPGFLTDALDHCDVLFNTAPAVILKKEQLQNHTNCIFIDLASVRGLSGENVIRAPGLPGRLAPRASGALIAETILRMGKEVF